MMMTNIGVDIVPANKFLVNDYIKENFPLDTFEEYDAFERKLANEEDLNIFVSYLLNNSKSP